MFPLTDLIVEPEDQRGKVADKPDSAERLTVEMGCNNGAGLKVDMLLARRQLQMVGLHQF